MSVSVTVFSDFKSDNSWVVHVEGISWKSDSIL